MVGMPIGKLARLVGLVPSAIRYYEQAGLLPKAMRVGGQRRYGPEIVGRLRIVQLARDAGFTIRETRAFVAGFSTKTTPAARWRALAGRKLTEIDSQMNRLAQMRRLLESSFRCRCLRIEDCERAMIAGCDAPLRRNVQQAG